jgi:acetolactate synthase I/II/III large subunit
MRVSGARAVALILRQLGVTHIWGIPGANTLALYDELSRLGLTSILVTNELSASFMADAYFRVSRRPGVCVAVPGPGITNMLTGVAEAFLDSSAMLVVTVSPAKSGHRFAVHDIPQLEILKPVVKNIRRISSVSEVNDLFAAYHSSLTGEPGPVVVELAGPVMDQYIDESQLRPGVLPEPERISPDAVARITHYLRAARQVGIYAGAGCAGAGEELLRLSEILSAPVATTISGRGIVPEDHPLSAGYGFGLTGTPAAYRVFRKCDLVLAIGTRFSEMATGGWGLRFKRLIHIDAAKPSLDSNYASIFSVQADARDAVEQLNASLATFHTTLDPTILQAIGSLAATRRLKLAARGTSNALHPAPFLWALRRCLARDAILCTDVGYHQLWTVSDFDVLQYGTYLTPVDYQAMGFGIPAAIAAAIARPDRTVVCVCGDGGFLLTGFELLTAVRERVRLVVFVFNDGALGLIKGLQLRLYNRAASVDLNNPDYEHLARSFGVRYVRISDDKHLEEGLQVALAHDGVTLVECKMVYDALPTYMRGRIRQSWNDASLSRKVSLVHRYLQRWR